MTQVREHPLVTPIVAKKIVGFLAKGQSLAGASMVCRQWRDAVEQIRLGADQQLVPELASALLAPLQERRLPAPSRARRGAIDKVSLDATGRYALVSNLDHDAWVVDCRDGEGRSHDVPTPRSRLLCHAINRAGSLAALGTRYSGVVLWNPADVDGLGTIFCLQPSLPSALAFSGDGLRLAVAGAEYAPREASIRLWDLQSHQCLQTIPQAETGLPFSLSLDFAGAMLAVSSSGALTVWDMTAEQRPCALPEVPDAAGRRASDRFHVALADGGKILGVATDHMVVCCELLSADRWRAGLTTMTPGRIVGFSMSASGAVTAFSTATGGVMLLNALNVPGFASRSCRPSTEGGPMALTPDGHCLVLGRADGGLSIVRAASRNAPRPGLAARLNNWWNGLSPWSTVDASDG